MARGTPRVQNAGTDWQVEFVTDSDGDMKEGDIQIDSELLLPARPEVGVGERTRRITTVHSGSHHTTREQTVDPFPRDRGRPVLAPSHTTTAPATTRTTS